MSRHVVVVTPPAPGHVFPVLPLIEELVARGDRVTMVTSADLAAAVSAAGAAVVELGWRPDTSRLTDAEFTVETLVVDLDGYLSAVETVLPALLERLHADHPAVVCSDAVVLGPLLAGIFSAPLVSLVPNFAVNQHVGLDQLVPGFDPTHPALARYGRRGGELFARHQVAPPAPDQAPALSLVFLPREFQIAGETFDASYRFIGPSLARRSRPQAWTPHGEGPVLLVSMGTAFTRRPEIFRAAAEAFAGTSWQLVMALGEHIDPRDLDPLPGNVEVAAHVPQLAVLHHAAAFISHSGMGSIMEALANQVPVVAIPHAAEQRLNATRLDELGLGLHLVDPAPTADRLRHAVEHVSSDPAIRTRLAAMRQAITDAGGAAAGADAIHALLGPSDRHRPARPRP